MQQGRGRWGRLINHYSVLSTGQPKASSKSVSLFWAISLLLMKDSFWQRELSRKYSYCSHYVEQTSRYFGQETTFAFQIGPQSELPRLFLTASSKNVLIFGSEIWIFAGCIS